MRPRVQRVQKVQRVQRVVVSPGGDEYKVSVTGISVVSRMLHEGEPKLPFLGKKTQENRARKPCFLYTYTITSYRSERLRL